jgi:hypothetical protein
MNEKNSDQSSSAETYTATLVGADSTETVELELIGGLPQKSFVRPAGDDGIDGADDQVWELDADTDGDTFVYRSAGAPGADYS